MRKFLLILAFIGCAHKPEAPKDPFLWLENVEDPTALKWVETQNQESMAALSQSPAFKKMEADTLKILESKDRIPGVSFEKNHVVNFWRDDKNVRGVLRRTTFENYKKKNIKWETVLDVDALAKKENENWIFKGFNCLEPAYKRCLATLSRGGKDASVVREFDQEKKAFVTDGFILPEAKARVDWGDENTLLVGTDFGPGTMTNSGYPRQIRLWKRGTPLAQAKVIFETAATDVWVSPSTSHHNGKSVSVISRAKDFFNTDEFTVDLSTGATKAIPKPAGADYSGYYDGQLLFQLRNPWNFNGVAYSPGALISIAEQAAGRSLAAADVQLVFAPKENQSYSGSVELKSRMVISILEDVKSKLLVTTFTGGKWQEPKAIEALTGTGQISLSAAKKDGDLFLYTYENFNQPSTLYAYDFAKAPTKLKSLPNFFDAKNLVVDQKFATSKDGTKIPYFLVYKKGLKFDGSAPTLQYGYGGFTVSQTAAYNAVAGKLWMEKGGVYVVANIRGGGEYGPKWHKAALKENRQKAYDDFIAVSEDLIRTKVTSPAHLAIRGGSNGGLLVGAVMVQRPDLYGAVLCWVPLLDMMRYSQLLAGASWVGEYGDPNDPQYREAILKYSPYQNVSEGKKYPPLLLVTSTKDDRVHPGHARKMAAKMKEQKHQVLYYENTEGGHAANSNFKQLARLNALQFEFLQQTIGKKGASKEKPVEVKKTEAPDAQTPKAM